MEEEINGDPLTIKIREELTLKLHLDTGSTKYVKEKPDDVKGMLIAIGISADDAQSIVENITHTHTPESRPSSIAHTLYECNKMDSMERKSRSANGMPPPPPPMAPPQSPPPSPPALLYVGLFHAFHVLPHRVEALRHIVQRSGGWLGD